MKTKDFIKMLQEEDPTGETHLRFPGGTPVALESKPGYWDGAYSYIDDNGNYVVSDKNSKIDVHCRDLEEFIWLKNGDTSKVILDVNQPELYKGTIERCSKEARDFDECLNKEMEEIVMGKVRDGWKIVKILDEKEKGFIQHWFIKNPKKFKKHDRSKVYTSNKNQQTMVLGCIRFIRKSGKFYQVRDENLGLVFYELKNK